MVNKFGNFINRVISFTNKNFEGKVPNGVLDEESKIAIKTAIEKVSYHLEKYEFRNSLNSFMELVDYGNLYLQNAAPWKTIKEDAHVAGQAMFVGAQIAAVVAQLCEPFMPFSAEKLFGYFNIEKKNWEDLQNSEIHIEAGHKIENAPLLFTPIEDNVIEAQIQKLENTKQNNKKTNPNANPMKDEITFDDFTKIDLRTATILEAEKVEKADKLLKLTVDTGVDVRTVVSGIAESFTPEEVIVKQVMILLNLAPRKIRGIESQGMLLLTTKPDGKLSFVTPDDSNVENGIEIG